MPDLIQIKRGDFAKMPTLASGELGYVRDKNELYIGTDAHINTTLTHDYGELSDASKGKLRIRRGTSLEFSEPIQEGEVILLFDLKQILVGIGNGDYIAFLNQDDIEYPIAQIESELKKKMNIFDKISAKQIVFDNDEDKIGLVHLKQEVIDALTGTAGEISFEVADHSITKSKLAYQCVDSRHINDGSITKHKILDREVTIEKLARDIQKKIYQIDDQDKVIDIIKDDIFVLKKWIQNLIESGEATFTPILLSDSIDSHASDVAATSRAVNAVYNITKQKVDIVPGKGLSTHDYTTEDHDKLGKIHIRDDGEVIAHPVELSDSIESISSDVAASSKAVNAVYNITKKKVDVAPGKTLSSNDYTTTEKEKLRRIKNDAEPNQNAFSVVQIDDISLIAKSPTDVLQIVSGENIVLSSEADTNKLTISTKGGSASGVIEQRYDLTSYLCNEWTTIDPMYEAPYAIKIGNYIMIEATLKNPNTNLNGIILNLPEELRPAKKHLRVVHAIVNNANYFVEITPQGIAIKGENFPNEVLIYVEYTLVSSDLTSYLRNGWVEYEEGYEKPNIQKVDDKVFVEGVIKNNFQCVGSTVFDLPEKFKPQNKQLKTINNRLDGSTHLISVSDRGICIEASEFPNQIAFSTEYSLHTDNSYDLTPYLRSNWTLLNETFEKPHASKIGNKVFITATIKNDSKNISPLILELPEELKPQGQSVRTATCAVDNSIHFIEISRDGIVVKGNSFPNQIIFDFEYDLIQDVVENRYDLSMALTNGWVQFDNTFGKASAYKVDNKIFVNAILKNESQNIEHLIIDLPQELRPNKKHLKFVTNIVDGTMHGIYISDQGIEIKNDLFPGQIILNFEYTLIK